MLLRIPCTLLKSQEPLLNISTGRIQKPYFTAATTAMTSPPQTQNAIEIQGPKEASFIKTRRLPTLRPAYILVKTHAVALNPTDWKHIDYMATPGALVGCDFSGEVIEVGPAVTKSWKKGDRVAGFAHGANKLELEDGAFAEYVVAKGDVQIRIPDSVSYEEAAGYGVGVFTVGQALYEGLKLPLPSSSIGSSEHKEKNEQVKKKTWVLIYGGSTATGMLAIQYAKASSNANNNNIFIVTTCSPRNNDHVKSLGADLIFDYKQADVGAKIRTATNNELYAAFDTVSEGTSLQICADALSSSPTAEGIQKRYHSLLGISKFPREDVAKKTTIAYSVLGEPLQFPGPGGTSQPRIPANVEDYTFMRDTFVPLTEKLIAERKVRISMDKVVAVKAGGLEGVLDGLRDMKEGKVSGQKWVYRVADTSS